MKLVPGPVGPPCIRFGVPSASKWVAYTGFGLGANDPFHIAITIRDPTSNYGFAASLGRNWFNRNSSRSITSSAGRGALTVIDDGYGEIGIIGNSYLTGLWVSSIAEFASTTSRRIIVNGSDIVTDSTSITLTNAPAAFVVGSAPDGAYYLNGVQLGHVAVFAGLASPFFIEKHRQGIHPTQLPGQLLECWDLDRVGVLRGHRGTLLIPSTFTMMPGGSGPNWAQGPPVLRRVYAFLGSSGGTTFAESIGLSAALALTPTTRMTMQGAVAMTAGASVADTAAGTLQAAATLAAIAALANDSTLRTSGATALTAETALTVATTASLVASLALTAEGAMMPGAVLLAQAVAALSAAATLGTTSSLAGGPTTYDGSMALTAQAGLLHVAVLNAIASVQVTGAASLTPSGALTASGASSLNAGTGVGVSGAITAQAALVMSLAAAINTAAAQVHAAATDLSAQTGIAAASQAQFRSALSLACAAVLQTAAAIPGTPTYDIIMAAAVMLRQAGVTEAGIAAPGANAATLGSAGATDESIH